MSDMKCPVCNQPLHDDHDGFYSCYSDNCCVSGGTLDTWQELIRTRKALGIAVDALKSVKRYLCEMPAPDSATALRMACESATTVKKALEQITATLENKNGNC